MDKVENFECHYQGYGILEEEGSLIASVTQSLGPLFQGTVSMYAKYYPNQLILSEDVGRTPFEHFQKINHL